MITTKMRENAHKIGFIVENYPDHKLNDVIKLFQMPAIDINTALWAAQDLILIGTPDPKTGTIEFLGAPEDGYNFGPTVTDLQEAIVYSFKELATKESDLEENYFSSWVEGYTTQDVLVSMKDLLNRRVIAEYEIKDTAAKRKKGVEISVYTFYTLFENLEKLWGAKQFKKNPLTGADQAPEK